MSVRRDDLGVAVGGGMIAGFIGGVALLMWIWVAAISTGGEVWSAFKTPGVPLTGERGLDPGFDLPALLIGALVHFALSISWGLLFGLVAYGWTRAATLGFGALYGLVVWLGMFYVALPAVGLRDMARSVPIPAAIAEHVVFGVALAVGFLPFQRPFARRIRAPAV